MIPNSKPPAENQSPTVSLEIIDRLDWQLGALMMVLIFVLGVGLLGLMFPFAFLVTGEFLINAPDRAFYGFSGLLSIALGYLYHQRNNLRELKRVGLLNERKRWEDELIHKAYYDSLTDLPNRALLMERLRLALSHTKRRSNYQFAVVFVDLDRFKWVNDSMGHQIGDEMLIKIAQRLQRCVRAVDTVARMGGDEFCLLLDDVQQVRDIFRTVERLQQELSLPISLQGREVFTSASIGISISSTGYEQAEDILRDADTAMYRAKTQGTGQQVVFDHSMHEHAVKVSKLEADIRRAIERDEFVLHYQPIVRIHTGQVAGLEALVRWSHPDFGLIPPAEFIPAAEAAGLIDSITSILLPKVCRQIVKWQEECPTCWPLSVSVNLPPQYLTKEDQVEGIVAMISEHQLQPRSVRLEITENQLMKNTESISKALLRLSNFGIRMYIDDFGTGFSSLSYLATLPVDTLKIDQSFIGNLSSNKTNSAIIQSINSLGHNLGLDVIAEGIETEEQLEYLKAIRCQFGQGYFISRPLDPGIVSEFLAEWFPANHDREKVAHRLPAFDLFAGLKQDEVFEISQTCEVINIPSGTVIIDQSQKGDYVYLMEEGLVGIYDSADKKSDFFVVLEAPTVFGEMALMDPGGAAQWEGFRTASVKALRNLRVLALPIIPFRSYLRRFPALRENLIKLVTDRLSPSRNSLM